MRRLALALAFLLALAPAQAAVKTAAQILAEINLKCPDNNIGLCTPALMRGFLADIVASYLNVGNNLADVPNAALARANLGVQSLLGSNVFNGVNSFTLNTIATLPAALPNTIVRAAPTDNLAARFEADGSGNSAFFSCARSDGTLASRSAVLADEPLCGFDAWAFNGGVNVGPVASLRPYAAETIGSLHQGSYWRLSVTPIGSTTLTDAIGVENDGGMTSPPSVTGGSQGPGTLNLSGDLYLRGVALESAAQTLANKTLASPAITGPATFAAAPIFTGQTGYAYANGASSLTFSATVPLAALGAFSADNVIINASAATAVPTSIVIPDCAGGVNALNYSHTTHTFTCLAISAAGSVNAGTSAQLAYYAASGAVVSGLTIVPVGAGGTGASSLTAHQVVLGQGSSAMSVAGTPGSTGLCLQSNSGADPSWGVCATGATVTPGYGIAVASTTVQAPLIAMAFAHQMGAM